MKRAVLIGALLTSTAGATPALAIEREQQLSLDAGASLLVIHNKSTPDLGASLGARYTYGLSDAFNLLAEGTFSLLATNQQADDPNRSHTYPAWLGNADVGIAYVFDVLTWVPYVAGMVGGYALSGGTISGMRVLPGAGVAVGLDYRLSPAWSVGLSFEEHFVTDTATYPSFTQALSRVEYNWGW